MGMAASQARFLSLTARKTNVEFEGQQINQQRTTLSNESSNYYSQLCNMVVPTPPSSEDYSKTIYTFKDGSENNTINSLIAQQGGWYILNYTQTYETESVMTNGNVIVSGIPELDENGNQVKEDGKVKYTGYQIGASPLRTMSEDAKITVGSAEAQADPYLKTITEQSQLDKILLMENEYLTMLREKYGKTDWFVRYQKNSTNGSYEPVFYDVNEIKNADFSEKTGASLSGIKSYTYGQTTESREIQNASARVTQDTSGRYMSVIIYDKDADGKVNENSGVEYMLTASTQSDDAAYNDAMNQYN